METSKVTGTLKIDLESTRERSKDGKGKRFRWETVSSIIDAGPKELL
jgi:hypothetical protein